MTSKILTCVVVCRSSPRRHGLPRPSSQHLSQYYLEMPPGLQHWWVNTWVSVIWKCHQVSNTGESTLESVLFGNATKSPTLVSQHLSRSYLEMPPSLQHWWVNTWVGIIWKCHGVSDTGESTLESVLFGNATRSPTLVSQHLSQYYLEMLPGLQHWWVNTWVST